MVGEGVCVVVCTDVKVESTTMVLPYIHVCMCR